MTLFELEFALDSGHLQLDWSDNGKWHTVRRNGKTKLWKTDSTRWAIPCKTGFKDCFTVATKFHDGHVQPDSSLLRIKEPNSP